MTVQMACNIQRNQFISTRAEVGPRLTDSKGASVALITSISDDNQRFTETHAMAVSPTPRPQSVAYNRVWASSQEGEIALQDECVNRCSIPVVRLRTTRCHDPRSRTLKATRSPSGDMAGYLAGWGNPGRTLTSRASRETTSKRGSLISPAAGTMSPSEPRLISIG